MQITCLPGHGSSTHGAKAAGALLMGKTATAELAYLHPAATRNPHDTRRTPGGSSSGSAAAVAADMVPLAIGTQTGGSMIRPAAYCGVVGYKPTFGAIPRTGVLSQSPSLDTVGVFARSVDAVALLAEQLFGYDAADPATLPVPVPPLLATCRSRPPATPIFAFVRGPYWEQAEADNRAALEELAGFLGEQCFEVELPAPFDKTQSIRECINYAEMARHFHRYTARNPAVLSDELKSALSVGCATLAHDYLAACEWPAVLNAGLDEIFTRCDAILTPAAPGVAPLSIGSTGSSIFNGTWTLCGTPAITLPLLEADALPLGVQLVGARGQDARLLRTAHWLMEHLTSCTGEDDSS